tara:strand:+ start:1129 stop:1296 length:168 start_codon:yes stop_codon:yes gene_type:complete
MTYSSADELVLMHKNINKKTRSKELFPFTYKKLANLGNYIKLILIKVVYLVKIHF